MRERDIPIGSAEFKDVASHFCTGIVVVTAIADERPVGMTCQSFVSVSLDPPLVLFCAALSSTTWPSIRAVGEFCVNVLADDQLSVCQSFAASGGNKFQGIAWEVSPAGHPSINGCLAHIECAIEDVREAGDHDVVIGRVRDLRLGSPGHPLLFYQATYATLLQL